MRKKRAVILVIVILILAAALVVIRGIYMHIESNLKSLADTALAQIELAAPEDGTYLGSHSVFPVSAKVSVTVRDHRITAIELMEHNNGQGALAEAIPGKVLDAQSLQVDVVAGATYSSKVILKAVENALLGGQP